MKRSSIKLALIKLYSKTHLVRSGSQTDKTTVNEFVEDIIKVFERYLELPEWDEE